MESSSRIKKRRLQLGLSQKEFVSALGMGQSSVSGYESGKTQPPYDTLVKIAEVLNTTTDYLTGKSNNPEPVFTWHDDDPQIETIVDLMRGLNAEGLTRLEEYTNFLLSRERYLKPSRK